MPSEPRIQRRLQLDESLWNLIDAMSAARGTTPARIVSEAILEKVGARAEHRIASDVATLVRPLADKIDYVFWHLTKDQPDPA